MRFPIGWNGICNRTPLKNPSGFVWQTSTSKYGCTVPCSKIFTRQYITVTFVSHKISTLANHTWRSDSLRRPFKRKRRGFAHFASMPSWNWIKNGGIIMLEVLQMFLFLFKSKYRRKWSEILYGTCCVLVLVGSACSLSTVKCHNDSDCGGNGKCVNDTCVCYDGWQGSHCQFCGGKVR